MSDSDLSVFDEVVAKHEAKSQVPAERESDAPPPPPEAKSRTSIPPPRFRADPERASVTPPAADRLSPPPPAPAKRVSVPPPAPSKRASLPSPAAPSAAKPGPLPPPAAPRGSSPSIPPPMPPGASKPNLPPPAPASRARAVAASASWSQEDSSLSRPPQVRRRREDESHPSVTPPPTPEPARPPPSGSKWGTAMAVCLGLAVVVGLVFMVARPKDGVLLVTVAGPKGAAVDDLKVLVDGAERCAQSPCRVDGLVQGQHLVKVIAEGYKPTPAKAIAVAAGGQAVVEVVLVRARRSAAPSGNAAAAQPPTASDPNDDTVDLNSLAAEEDRPAAGPGPVSAGPKPPAWLRESGEVGAAESKPVAEEATPQPAGMGTLRINSIPASNIVVDGRPRGTTPTVIQVSPGAHSVVFVHSTYGRKVRGVSVTAGGTAVASVKFP